MEKNNPAFLQKQEGISSIDRISGEIVSEKIAGEKVMKWVHETVAGRTLMQLFSMKVFSVLRGQWANKNISEQKLRNFAESYGINENECQKPLNEYPTRNELFTRSLKPGAREIVSEEKTACIPSDSAVWVQTDINPESILNVKNKNLSLAKILNDEDLAESYRGGTFICCRLRPEDYHHWHSPVEGVPSEPRKINGSLNSVSPLAIRNNLKIWGENKRDLFTIDSELFGKVTVVTVGATFVGEMEHSFSPQKMVQKGEDLGKFYIGGSTVLLGFEAGKINLSPDLLENSQKGFETICKMGEALGTCPEQ